MLRKNKNFCFNFYQKIGTEKMILRKNDVIIDDLRHSRIFETSAIAPPNTHLYII